MWVANGAERCSLSRPEAQSHGLAKSRVPLVLARAIGECVIVMASRSHESSKIGEKEASFQSVEISKEKGVSLSSAKIAHYLRFLKESVVKFLRFSNPLLSALGCKLLRTHYTGCGAGPLDLVDRLTRNRGQVI